MDANNIYETIFETNDIYETTSNTISAFANMRDQQPYNDVNSSSSCSSSRLKREAESADKHLICETKNSLKNESAVRSEELLNGENRVILSPSKRRKKANNSNTSKAILVGVVGQEDANQYLGHINEARALKCTSNSSIDQNYHVSTLNHENPKFKNALNQIDELINLFKEPINSSFKSPSEEELSKSLNFQTSSPDLGHSPKTLNPLLPMYNSNAYFGSRDHWILTTQHVILQNYVPFAGPSFIDYSLTSCFCYEPAYHHQSQLQCSLQMEHGNVINYPDVWLERHDSKTGTVALIPDEETAYADYCNRLEFRQTLESQNLKESQDGQIQILEDNNPTENLSKLPLFFKYEFTTLPTANHYKMSQRSLDCDNNQNLYANCTLYNVNTDEEMDSKYRLIIANPRGICFTEFFAPEISNGVTPINFSFKSFIHEPKLNEISTTTCTTKPNPNFIETTNGSYRIKLPIKNSGSSYGSIDCDVDKFENIPNLLPHPKILIFKDGHRLDYTLFNDQPGFLKFSQDLCIVDQQRSNSAASKLAKLSFDLEMYKPANTFFVRQYFSGLSGDYMAFILNTIPASQIDPSLVDKNCYLFHWPNTNFKHLSFFKLYQKQNKKRVEESEGALCFDPLLLPAVLGVEEPKTSKEGNDDDDEIVALIPESQESRVTPQSFVEGIDDLDIDANSSVRCIRESVTTHLYVIADSPALPVIALTSEANNVYDYHQQNCLDSKEVYPVMDAYMQSNLKNEFLNNFDNLSLISSIPSDIFTTLIPPPNTNHQPLLEDLTASKAPYYPLEISRVTTPAFPNPPPPTTTTNKDALDKCVDSHAFEDCPISDSTSKFNKNYYYFSYCYTDKIPTPIGAEPLYRPPSSIPISPLQQPESYPFPTANNDSFRMMNSNSKVSSATDSLDSLQDVTACSNTNMTPIPLDDIEDKIKYHKNNLNVIYTTTNTIPTGPESQLIPSIEHMNNKNISECEEIRNTNMTMNTSVESNSSSSSSSNATTANHHSIKGNATNNITPSSMNALQQQQQQTNNEKFNRIKAKFENNKDSSQSSSLRDKNLNCNTKRHQRSRQGSTCKSDRSSSISYPPSSILSSALPDDFLTTTIQNDRSSVAESVTPIPSNFIKFYNQSKEGSIKDISESFKPVLSRDDKLVDGVLETEEDMKLFKQNIKMKISQSQEQDQLYQQQQKSTVNEFFEDPCNLQDSYQTAVVTTAARSPSNIHLKQCHQAVKWKRPSMAPPTPPFQRTILLGSPILTTKDNSQSQTKSSNGFNNCRTTAGKLDSLVHGSLCSSPTTIQRAKILLSSRHSLPLTTSTPTPASTTTTYNNNGFINNRFSRGSHVMSCSPILTTDPDSANAHKSSKKFGLNGKLQGRANMIIPEKFRTFNIKPFQSSTTMKKGSEVVVVDSSHLHSLHGKIKNSMQKCKILVHNI